MLYTVELVEQNDNFFIGIIEPQNMCSEVDCDIHFTIGAFLSINIIYLANKKSKFLPQNFLNKKLAAKGYEFFVFAVDSLGEFCFLVLRFAGLS